MIKKDKILEGKELQQFLSEKMDATLYSKLVLHVTQRLQYRYGLRLKKNELVDRAQELVQELLEDVFVNSTRSYNTAKYPTVEKFLRSALDSHIYNQFRKNKPSVSSIEAKGHVITKEKNHIVGSAEAKIITEEGKQMIRELLEEWNADDDEKMVFECLFDGFQKPKEIREELGISAQEFGAIWRRIRRKQNKLQQKIIQDGRS